MSTTNRTGWSSTKPDAAKRLVSCGDCIPPGCYRRHSSFTHAVYFACGDALAAVVDEAVGSGPLNIVLDRLDPDLDSPLRVESTRVEVAGQIFAIRNGQRYNSAVIEPPGADANGIRPNLAAFKSAVQRLAAPQSLAFLLDPVQDDGSRSPFEFALRSRFRNAGELILRGDFVAAAMTVKGLGVGLTPAGDDLIAGLLIALHCRRRIFHEDVATVIDNVFAAAQSANPYAAAFLRCAHDGRVSGRVQGLIASLCGRDAYAVEQTTRDMLMVGATSGADTAVGLALGLEHYFSSHQI